MTYSLGKKSLAELEGVDPRLVSVVKRAIQITKQDFTVYDGIRTLAQQREYYAAGTSKTMKSKHLDGLAVDLVPWIGGKPRWWWPQIYEVAAAMLTAARELRVDVKWGCVWDRVLNDLAPGVLAVDLPDALRREGLAYNKRHAGPDFPDGPHYELLV